MQNFQIPSSKSSSHQLSHYHHEIHALAAKPSAAALVLTPVSPQNMTQRTQAMSPQQRHNVLNLGHLAQCQTLRNNHSCSQTCRISLNSCRASIKMARPSSLVLLNLARDLIPRLACQKTMHLIICPSTTLLYRKTRRLSMRLCSF